MDRSKMDYLETDVLVIGAGLAGICASIQAARMGCSVVLIEKGRVLGGNSGPDVGVHPGGAHCYHPYAYETGVIGELMEEAGWRKAKTWTRELHYNMSQQWDTVLYEKLAQAGVRVFRCNYAKEPVMDGNRIEAVVVEDTAVYRTRYVKVRCAVVESSGDGHIAKEAGADYARGREAKSRYNERSAPEREDAVTLGSSLVALVRKTERPIDFIPPEGTPEFYPGYWGNPSWSDALYGDCRFFYPTETGGEIDTIEDEHEIYDRALAHLYSAWNQVKNVACVEESRNWDLIWVSPKLARRESRRFIGDYVLTQNDVEEGKVFHDAVAYGGFAVDLHDPKEEKPEYVRVFSYSIPPIYTIPYRCLYSRNISNLFLASRLISVTHIAHGTTRLMATLSTVGQAVGAAAALCKKYGCAPRDVYTNHLRELQQTLLKEDATIVGIKNDDPSDLAREAKITASSEQKHGVETLSGWLPLHCDRGVMLWDWGRRLDVVSCYLKNCGDRDAVLRAALKLYHRKEKIKKHEDEFDNKGFSYWKHRVRVEWGADDTAADFATVQTASAVIPAGFEGWVSFDLSLDLMEKDATCDDTRYLFEIARADHVVWGMDDQFYDFARRAEKENDGDQYRTFPNSHLYRVSPSIPFGEASNITNGIGRRFSSNPVNMWCSKREEPLPQHVRLNWEEAREFNTVQITFDNLHRSFEEIPLDCGERVSGMLVKDYHIDAMSDAGWTTVCEVKDNYNRQRRHRFPLQKSGELRIVVDSVWDDRYTARIYEVRVYNETEAMK